ncbi:amidohydrolase family protein [Phytohabitans kaempferiae]|uniref:Amidohydrolase family protein n=1 Tax=Phytohabitans kaempferiae TaxID=1620943 RepID=A0ABV6M7Y9_9ACTN
MKTFRAVVGGTVIDGTGAPGRPGWTVLIEGNRIRSVHPDGSVELPEGVEIIDAHGCHVIPGLMDANVHVTGANTTELMLQYESDYSPLIDEGLQIALRAGVTTVFDTAGILDVLVAARERVENGSLVGSRLFLAGQIIGFPEAFGPDAEGQASGIFGPDTTARLAPRLDRGVNAELVRMAPDEVRAHVREYIETSGIDFVKYAACTHIDPAQAIPYITFSEAAQRAIVEEGHRAGLTVQAHTMSPESLRMEIEAGADILQHGSITGNRPLPDETLEVIVERQLPVAALLPNERYHTWMEAYGPEPRRSYAFNRILQANNRRLIEAGARLLLTTDGFVEGSHVRSHPAWSSLLDGAVDSPWKLGEGHFLWLEAVTEMGMAPMEVLLSGTRYIAEAYQQPELGTLEPGKRADLLVLDGDPLRDVRAYRRIVQIVKDGTRIDRSSLPTRRIVSDPDH